MKDALDSLVKEDGMDATVFSLCEWGLVRPQSGSSVLKLNWARSL